MQKWTELKLPKLSCHRWPLCVDVVYVTQEQLNSC